jgi:toxin ParE1/3/4
VRLGWSSEALKDRREIRSYIASDNPAAAARLDRLFTAVAGKLVTFPYLGSVGRLPDTREIMPHPNYRLIYEVQESQI